MTNSTFRDLGVTSVIQGAREEENIVPAVGNGAAIPGDLVYIDANGKVQGADLGAAEYFRGILMEHYSLGTETAITDSLKCDVVVPKSGRDYVIRHLDLNVDGIPGLPLDVSATAGKADVAADVNNAIFRCSKPNTDGDTIMIATKE